MRYSLHFWNMRNHNENQSNSTKYYYAVYIPEDNGAMEDATKFIFDDKDDALQVVKANKKARFKQFRCDNHSKINAVQFAQSGLWDNSLEHTDETISSNNNKRNYTNGFGDKSNLFKAPKAPDFATFRKYIENGDVEAVQQVIWANPKYLISSGDTPAILQEGFRYNALHIAARSKQASIVELILNTISNADFINSLFGIEDDCEERINILVDLYLNTPDKGLNETPLHFASKFGAADVVEVLVSYPQCDKSLKNKFNETADMIICKRCPDVENDDVKKKIALLLNAFYYVPILRAEGNCIPPIIGEPFSPGHEALTNEDPLSPRLEIRAFAGPMDKQDASRFRKMWKTPPRVASTATRRDCTPAKDYMRGGDDDDEVVRMRLTDTTKGLERMGHHLANQMSVEWKEYWPFLDAFVDICSSEGLDLLENHLEQLMRTYYQKFRKIKTRVESSTDDGMSNLCVKLARVFREHLKSQTIERTIEPLNDTCIEKTCEVFSLRLWNGINNNLPKSSLNMNMEQLEQTVCSYRTDNRFRDSDFEQRVHETVAKYITDWIIADSNDEMRRKVLSYYEDEINEGFLTDEENHITLNDTLNSCNRRHIKSHLMCVLSMIRNRLYNNGIVINADDYEAPQCSCRFSKINRRNKQARRLMVSKKLDFADNIPQNSDTSTSSDDDDVFYTPPQSPVRMMPENGLSDSDDAMNTTFQDSEAGHEVYVDGESYPTKTDNEIFNALQLQHCQIDSEKYPNIYRWLHNIKIYSKAERERWPSIGHTASPPVCMSPEPANRSILDSYSTKPWLRITGRNSPRRASRGSPSYCRSTNSPMTHQFV